jgi:hypothetical protein
MGSPERLYHGTVRALSIVIAGLGAAILAVTLVAGGGPLSAGFLMGLAFLAVGVGRLVIANRMQR